MLPLLPRHVLGMPLILLVLVVGMSQNTKTQILGLTKTNYDAPKMNNKAQTIMNQKTDPNHIIQGSPIITALLSFIRVITSFKLLISSCS